MANKKSKSLPFMGSNTIYERKGDYDPAMKLIIKEDCLGDISIGILDPNNRQEPIRLVKFATASGDGKSMNVLHALPDLALAIEKDNKENPDYK